MQSLARPFFRRDPLWIGSGMLALLALPFLFPGCAPWTEVRGPYCPKSAQFSLRIPPGWMRLNSERYLLLSKDGPFLQYILIQQRPLKAPFRHTRKKLKPSMLPLEAAQVILDEISCDPAVRNFRLLENKPAVIDDHDGFTLFFTYRDREGMVLQTMYYGFLNRRHFYSLRFTAAKRYYFQKDLKSFMDILGSFRLLSDEKV